MVRKKDLIKKLQERLDLKSFREAEHIFDTYGEILKEALKDGDAVKLYGIGILKKGKKKARKITVPGIDHKVEVPERTGVFFHVDKDFEKSLN